MLPDQTAQAHGNPRYHLVHSVISPVRQIVEALWDRVQKPGKERLVMAGSLSRARTVSSVQIILELPGLLRLDEVGGRGKSMVFDFTSLNGASAADDDDESVAESIQNHTVETFLGSLGRGASVRCLGDRFKVTGSTRFLSPAKWLST